jgi:peroxiredoxin
VKGLSSLLILVVALTACEASDSKQTATERGVRAPEMSLTFLDGTMTSLSKLEGKVVLLNFWATWCPPCKQELPHFEALHRAYKEKGLTIVGVSMDQAEPEYVQTFVNDAGLTYPVAMAPFEEIEKVWTTIEGISTVHGFGDEVPTVANGSVQMMPTTFVIDRSGHIVRKHVGPRDRKTFEPELRNLMGLSPSS